MLILAKKIKGVYPDGFGSYMVIGRRGIGKSSYALKCLYNAYVLLGYDEDEAWKKALSSLQFSISEVITFLKRCVNKDEKELCLIWDDTRTFASGSQYHLNMKLCTQLGSLLDTVRTAINCLILTCPSSEGLLGILKTYDDYLIKIKYSDRGGFYRVATGYLWSTLPAGQKRIYTKFRDNYSCRLPDDIYKKYMVRRKKALSNILVDVEQTIKND